METKSALITGITGMDGSYLAELLLSKGYDVYGLVRRTSHPTTSNLNHMIQDLRLIQGDVTDPVSLNNAFFESKPDEVYNLAAQSFVGTSWDQPLTTSEINAIGALNMLNCAKVYKCKFYQASTSEMFGNYNGAANEQTPFNPRSPYGVSKLFAHHMTINYRESFNLPCCCGILFNHESPRRGLEFVTRKITHTIARIVNGEDVQLTLGNVSAKRDWGAAPDYVRAMWLMMQQEGIMQDYVIATGEAHSVLEFVDESYKCAGLNPADSLKINPNLYRPADISSLVGDSSKARKELDWKPTKTFKELVQWMVDSDIAGYRSHPS